MPRPRLGLPPKVRRVFIDDQGNWRRSRYKVLHGGRGSSKSESVCRLAISIARNEKTRFLCVRMFQNSIADSIHKTLADAIVEMGLEHEFDIQKTTIICLETGTDFIFKGIQRDIAGIKSLKGVKYCIVEEADTVPKDAWLVLDPTLRVDDSEFWIVYNPDDEMDATHQMFSVHPPEDAIVAEVNWRDNPFFPPVLDRLRRQALARTIGDDGTEDAAERAIYDWIWEGKPRKITDAIIFRNRVVVRDFDEPDGMRPFYGADWGFADDPTVLIRSYMHDDCLFITHEAFGYHIEIDNVPGMIFDKVQGSREWPIKGDAAQPMIISYLERKGYNISAAEKWPGSVEDGVALMKGFRQIVVHPRCPNIGKEFRLYSYKTDPRQLDGNGQPLILPIIVDKYNHGIDAVRYSLDGYIRGQGAMTFTPEMLDMLR